MKTLYVLRHGQAAPESEAPSDHARALTPRGRAEVGRSAEYLGERGKAPSLVLSSSAARALGTARLCLATWSPGPELTIVDSLYLAGPQSYLLELAARADPHPAVMVVGHNPGLEELVHVLTARSEHLATAALIEIELPLAAWSELSAAERHVGRVVSGFRP